MQICLNKKELQDAMGEYYWGDYYQNSKYEYPVLLIRIENLEGCPYQVFDKKDLIELKKILSAI